MPNLFPCTSRMAPRVERCQVDDWQTEVSTGLSQASTRRRRHSHFTLEGHCVQLHLPSPAQPQGAPFMETMRVNSPAGSKWSHLPLAIQNINHSPSLFQNSPAQNHPICQSGTPQLLEVNSNLGYIFPLNAQCVTETQQMCTIEKERRTI